MGKSISEEQYELQAKDRSHNLNGLSCLLRISVFLSMLHYEHEKHNIT